MNENVKLFNDDCLNAMKNIPDKSIDMILTDAPYLMAYFSKRRKNKNHDFCLKIKNDKEENKDLIKDYIKECYRILKDNTAAYFFCNSNKIDLFKQYIEEAGFKIKNIIVWVKNNHTAGDLEAAYGKKYEMIIYCNKGRKKINGKRLTDVWYFDRVVGDNQVHQNQKPVDLLEQCILKSSNEGDFIFDGFMGSGSTGVACINTNRKFIGIELEENYFNIAKERINKAIEDKDAI